MKYGEFMAYHKKNSVGQLYLLAGEEGYYIEKAKKRILEMLFPDGVNVEDIQELPSAVSIGDFVMYAESVPFFTDKNVIIVKDMALLNKKTSDEDDAEVTKMKGKKAKKTPEDIFMEFIENIPEFTTIILINHKSLDKRRKLYKTIAKHAITLEAEQLKNYNTTDIGDWLHGKLQELHKEMDSEAMQYFLTAVSMMQTVSLGFLEQELNKLALFMGKEQRRIDRRLLVNALADIPEVSGFAMLDAISAHNTKRALYLLQRQVDSGTYLPIIVGLMVSHVRRLIQAKEYSGKGLRGKSLANAIGGPSFSPFIADRLARESNSFTADKLENAFLELADADYRSKSGKGTSAEIENIIISLCA